jgi:purine-nucleoside phosphorylase
MIKDLTKSDWLQILQLPESKIPSVIILRGTRNFDTQYQAMLPFFDNIIEVGTPNGIIENVFIGEVRGFPIGFACVYGSSMASEIVHIFGVLGTRIALQIGNCGAIADDFQAGDLFIADRAYCGEGAAQYYKSDSKWVSGSMELLETQTLSQFRSSEIRRGAIYTTAALFAESEADILRWYDEGFAAVDMETATTYAVAESFGMKRLSLLYAFDNPRAREHILLSNRDKDTRRSEGNQKVKELILDLAVELCSKT